LIRKNIRVTCIFKDKIPLAVKEIGFEPLRVVFRDNGFASAAVRISIEQIFKQLSPSTEVKSI